MKMHLKAFLYLFITGAAMLTLVTSCKNECKDVECLNGGVCNEETGECDCPDAYSGGSCEIVDICLLNEVECLNEGECVNGLCQCAGNFAGERCERCEKEWEGDTCEIKVRDKFFGVYSVSSTCEGGNSYNMNVTEASGGLLNIDISNIEATGNTAIYDANVKRNDSVFLNSQNLIGTPGATIVGTGKLLRNVSPWRLVIEVDVTRPDTAFTCTITGLKQ